EARQWTRGAAALELLARGARDDGASEKRTGEAVPQKLGRVLLADDNADMGEYVERLLSEAGWEVEAVPDGNRALAAVQTRLPDVVVTDVMMPGLDGFQLLRALRDTPATATIPVIL